jgi:SAM-dependent methyltransferase
MKASNLVRAQCPVCQYSLGAKFFNGGEQPLATLGWSKSAEEAQGMTRHPLSYVQCPRCTHVWNRSFTYEAIPYTNNPNRMFNKGSIWQGHLQTTRDILVSMLSANPTVIDIGCGEGHFVRGIAEAFGGKGRFMGFDPNTSSESGLGVEFHARYFDPIQDILSLEPDVLIMRHVLEHLTNPAEFMDELAWGAAELNKPIRFFAEMPCIDKVFSSMRLVDFFYEHPSQFTTESFETLMSRGGKVMALNHGYDGEVVYGLVELGVPQAHQANAQEALNFYQQAQISRRTIQSQLKDLITSGKKVAIWGGTGKAAAFINYFEANAEDFPLVVDSDRDKVGTFVPRTGQIIQYRDILKTVTADVVIIPPQWRAKDIVAEINREGIHVDQILIEHDGMLIDFMKATHLYG